MSSFISSYSLNTLFIKINSSWLTFELVEALEIIASVMLLFIFLNYWLIYYLVPPVIAQIFNPIAELVIPIGILTKELKAEIKIDPVNVEAKIRKCLI